VHVHAELGVAVRVRRGARGRPGGGTADGADEDLPSDQDHARDEVKKAYRAHGVFKQD
jgi:hypothetical protein